MRGGKHLLIDRGNLFIFEKPMASFEEIIPIKEGIFETKSLTVVISLSDHQIKPNYGFKSLWEEGLAFSLPNGNYYLAKALASMKFKGKLLDKLWNDRKVPAYFRDKIPAIFSEKGLEKELLSGEREAFNGFFSILIKFKQF